MPEGHMMTVAFTIGLTTLDLKNHFANELQVPSEFIQITLNGDHALLSTLVSLIILYINTQTQTGVDLKFKKFTVVV